MQILISMLFILLMFRKDKFVIFRYGKDKEKRVHMSLMIMFIILTFFLIFRFQVGYDYNQYYRYYNNFKGAQYFEPYGHLVYFLASKLGSPWFIFAFYGLPTMIFFYLAIKENSVDPWASTILFTTMFYLDCMSMIRQGLAVAIVIFAFKYAKNKKLLPFIGWIIVATLSHTTALVAIPIYFIYNYLKFEWILIIDFFVIVFAKKIMTFLIDNIRVLNRFSVYYTQGVQGGRMIRIFYLLLFLVTLFCYILAKRKYKVSDEITKYLSVIAMGVALVFSFVGANGTRLAESYFVIYIFLLPKIFKDILNKYSYYISLLPFVAYYCTFLLIDSRNISGYTPYKFFF